MYRFLLLLAALAAAIILSACGGGSATRIDSADEQQVIRPPFAIPTNGLDVELTNQPGYSISTSRWTSSTGPRFKNRQTSVKKGLGFLQAHQKSLDLWDWVSAPYGPFGPFDAWEWYLGDGDAQRNIQGEVIDYMLRSSMMLPGKNNYDELAMTAIDDWLKHHVSATKSSDRCYSFEVGAMLAAAEHSGNSEYSDLAAEMAMRTVDDVADGPGDNKFTGTEYADRFVTNRHSLCGWDAAAYALYWDAAGTAVGGDQGAVLQQWARDLLDRIWERKTLWENVAYGEWDYTHLSYGYLLEAYSRVDPLGYSGQRDELRALILDQQSADGYWYAGSATNRFAFDDLQATYSCLLGLDADHVDLTITARQGGEDYLRSQSMQLATGGFNGYLGDPGPLNNELCAEATYGLAVGLNRSGK